MIMRVMYVSLFEHELFEVNFGRNNIFSIQPSQAQDCSFIALVL